jgi:hypothetical protein
MHHWRTKAHLDPTHVLPDIRSDDRPSLSVGRSIRLCDANRELPKHATEKLEIGELDRVDPNVVARSTTTNCGPAASHGESMYWSHFDDRMFDADLASRCAV